MTANVDAAKALEPLTASRVALLTTYKRNGEGVGTPVGRILKDDRVVFTTRSKTWKVKRLARNPWVTLAPCTRSGKVIGATVEGTARRVPFKEAGELSRFELIQAAVWILFYRVIYRDVPVSYEFQPALQGSGELPQDPSERVNPADRSRKPYGVATRRRFLERI